MKVLFVLMSLTLVSSGALADPIPMAPDAQDVASVMFSARESIARGLERASVPANATLSGGTFETKEVDNTRSDFYRFDLFTCGPTDTTPCRFAGKLTVIKKTKRLVGATQVSIQVIVTSTEESSPGAPTLEE